MTNFKPSFIGLLSLDNPIITPWLAIFRPFKIRPKCSHITPKSYQTRPKTDDIYTCLKEPFNWPSTGRFFKPCNRPDVNCFKQRITGFNQAWNKGLCNCYLKTCNKGLCNCYLQTCYRAVKGVSSIGRFWGSCEAAMDSRLTKMGWRRFLFVTF